MSATIIPFPSNSVARSERDQRVLEKLQQELVDDGYPARKAFELASMCLEIANAVLGKDSLRTN